MDAKGMISRSINPTQEKGVALLKLTLKISAKLRFDERNMSLANDGLILCFAFEQICNAC